MTFNRLTPKSIGVFLFLSSICVWSMKFVGWEILELLHYNKVWTDGRTDRQTDKVITIGLPHLPWRGPNKSSVCSFLVWKSTIWVSDRSSAMLIIWLLTRDGLEWPVTWRLGHSMSGRLKSPPSMNIEPLCWYLKSVISLTVVSM